MAKRNLQTKGHPHFLMAQFPGPVPGKSWVLAPVASSWFREQVDRLGKDGAFVRSLRTLTDEIKGVPAEESSYFLTTYACAAVISGRVALNRKAREETWADETGKTWKALKEFPERIERIACEMERINQHPLLAPEKSVNEKGRDAKIARQSFRDLPSIMRLFAKALNGRILLMPKLHADVFPADSGIHYLQLAVRSWTGKPHDRKVAELLNAAAVALDQKAAFDAITLAQMRYRKRKKT
jgi:hypothetical protein